MSLTIKIGDFVAVRPDKKTFILLVDKIKGEKARGTVYNKMPYTEETMDFLLEDVLANLGSNPKAGSIYGCSFDIFDSKAVSSFGDVNFFGNKSKKEKKEILAEIETFYTKIKKKSLHKFLPLIIEVQEEKGNLDGHYVHHYKGDSLDILSFHLAHNVDNAHIFFHEYGHGVWYHLLDDRIRAHWTKAYYKHVEINRITKENYSQHLAAIEGQYKQTVSDYRKTIADKEEKKEFNKVLSQIKKVHALDLVDLDTLRSQNKSLKKFWPRLDIEESKFKMMVSDYAQKNSREHFCECFAMHMIGEKIPKSLQKLMEKTLTKIAGRKSMVGKGD